MGNVERRERRRPRALRCRRVGWAVAALLAVALAAPALGQMKSAHVGRHLCETRGGGKFVRIPGFPGERIDRRLLPDVRRLLRKYDLFVTDGYSMDPVHDVHGEHPLGLALDVVPDEAHGGSWNKVARLAHRAEPAQNHPRAPYRWVGWNGDAGHGRGNHLHLSWMHNDNTTPGHPAHTVITRKCPGSGSSNDHGSSGDRRGTRHRRDHRTADRHHHRRAPSGGVSYSRIRHSSGGTRADV